MAKSTLGNVRDAPSRGSVWLRRLALGALLAVLILSLTGLLGNMNRTLTTTEQDYTLSLEYPRVARTGLDVPWELTISAPGGWGVPRMLDSPHERGSRTWQVHPGASSARSSRLRRCSWSSSPIARSPRWPGS